MTIDDIKNEISRLLSFPAAKQNLQLNDNSLDRAYEAYVWSLCKRAVEKAGGTAKLVGRDGNPTRNIVLRGAPGHMASNRQDFCYIKCCLNGKEFEIHLDVQYEGRSHVLHEVDVSIYDHADAEKVRRFARQPSSKGLIAMVECKFYQTTPPGIALGRQFIGLISDFTGGEMNAFVSNKSTPSLKNFLKYKSQRYRRNIKFFTDLVPGSGTAEQRFVNYLEIVLVQWST